MPFGKKQASSSMRPASNSTGSFPLRSIFRRRERGPVAYAITFVDKLAIRVPSLDAWDQFVWPPVAAMPQAPMEAEQYGYCHGQAIDLGPIMLVMQFNMMDEVSLHFLKEGGQSLVILELVVVHHFVHLLPCSISLGVEAVGHGLTFCFCDVILENSRVGCFSG